MWMLPANHHRDGDGEDQPDEAHEGPSEDRDDEHCHRVEVHELANHRWFEDVLEDEPDEGDDGQC
jgi:hypothetical protein